MTLELRYKPDAAQAFDRMQAWWEGAILDRPTLQVSAPRPDPRPLPQKQHATLRDRWMDAEYNVECADIHLSNTYWGGELMPSYFPNLGPEVLTASLGAELVFSEETSWSKPILTDWNDIPKLRVDPQNEYVQAILQMTRLALEAGSGKFLVGITDLHPGGDLAASLRDPQQFCLDLATEPDSVQALMDQIRPCFYDFYTLQYDLMLQAGQTITTSWLPLIAQGRYYIPSCDLACMISKRQFNAYCLPHILAEVEWLDRSIFHLDGPNALHHLDTLLQIEKLDAIQFVCGAGHEPAVNWMPVFQRIQQGGKNIHVAVRPQDIPAFMEGLNPEGVMLNTWASSIEEADALLRLVSRWTRRQS